ncbi:MAG: hypothetical protein LUI87_02345 [Lachnospiraceae bacterium]|nr:hypothetical protein [Lachnospiraceae bacterium]
MITMTLADGTEVTFSGMNGTNYIVPDKKEMDTSVFTEENLVSGKFTDEDGTVEEFANLRFIQQQKQLDGDYYICFWQKTEQELKDEATEKYISTLEDALLELYESTI